MIKGKGFFIWVIRDLFNCDFAIMAFYASLYSLDWVTVKVANGTYPYNRRLPSLADDLIPDLQEAMSTVGVQTYGWHYLYGDYPKEEAAVAASRIKKFDLKAYILDPEAEYKRPGMARHAKVFMSELRDKCPDIPIYLCSYRFPTLHPELPWKEFLSKCDGHMPQVYWVGADNPAAQLARSVRELRTLEKNLGLKPMPVVPVGAAYHERGWQPAPGEITAFAAKADAMRDTDHVRGFSYWEWANAERYGLAAEAGLTQWQVDPTEPPPPPGGVGLKEWADAITNWAETKDYTGPYFGGG